jgi:hypothetical protein
MTLGRISPRIIGVGLVLAAMVISALVIGAEGIGQTLYSDEWGYAVRASQSVGDALFQPPARKYLLVVPMLFYELLFHTAGADDYTPYRVMGIILLLLCAGLFYQLARRGLGDIGAVPPTVLLLFMGSAWDVVVSPLRVPSLFAMAAGLAMLLCLEREDRSGDLAAAVLLLIALTSHPLGLAFAAAALVLVILRPVGERWEHSWTVLAPIGLYASWWLFVRNPGAGATPDLSNLSGIPKFVAQSFAGATSTLTGVPGIVAEPGAFSVQDSLDSPLTWIVAIVIAALLAIGFRSRLRLGPPAPMFWAVLTALVSLWVSTAIAPRPIGLRPAADSRYLFPSALLLLLLVSGLGRGIRVPRAVLWITTSVLALGFIYNVSELDNLGGQIRERSNEVRAYFGALELARGHVSPDFVGDFSPATSLTAGAYFKVAGDFGTPAATPSQISNSTIGAAVVADHVLAQALRLQLLPGSTTPPPGGTAPIVEGLALAKTHGGCVRARPSAGLLTAELALPPGGVWLRSRQIEDVAITIGRFAPPQYALAPPQTGSSVVLKIPTDRAPNPWNVIVTAKRPVSLCGLRPRSAPPVEVPSSTQSGP